MKEIVYLKGLTGPPFTDGSTFRVLKISPHGGAGTVDIGVVKRGANFLNYKPEQLWGHIEDPQIPIGTEFRLEQYEKTGYAKVVLVNPTEGGKQMQGNVYEGVVVQTTQVPAGEGLTSSVPKSEIILTVPAFLAKDDTTAQATVMAKAIEAGHKLDDPVVVVEVKVRKYA